MVSGMRNSVIAFLAIFLLSACATDDDPASKPKPRLIDRDQSKILLLLNGVPANRIRYFHLGWNETYSKNRYWAGYRNRTTGAHAEYVAIILAVDRIWGAADKVTADVLKRYKIFRDKTIVLGKGSPAIQGYSDSGVAAPNYLLFEADGRHCAFGRRLSSVNQDKNYDSETFAISGFYCAPRGERIDEKRAYQIIAQEVVFVPDDPGAPSSDNPNWDIRRIVIQWDGRTDALLGTVTFPRGKREGKISVTLPQGKGMCEGTFIIPGGGRGSWLMRCPEGIAADGWFKALGKGKGSVGEGTDNKGRSIKFTVLGT